MRLTRLLSVLLIALAAALVFCWALVRSPFGAVLRGIRENEAKTLALGYNTRLYKIAVVALAYLLGGLAGALYAPFAGFANTELVFWLFSGQVLIMVIVGGSGTLIGPILGAALFAGAAAVVLFEITVLFSLVRRRTSVGGGAVA